MMLIVWFLTTGAHWDLVQVAAWAKMFVANTAAMSVRDAAAKTFDPTGMCGLCHAVADAKREEQNTPALGGLAGGKAPLILQDAACTVFGPSPRQRSLRECNPDVVIRRRKPPLPVPRIGAA